MSKKMNVVLVKTQNELSKIANERGAIRVGSTYNPQARAASYAHEGYRGTMYAAPTNNMIQSENRFLRDSATRHNVHGFSNAQDEKGYVYVVKGQRRN